MFCSLTRRMISRAEDRGKAWPRWAERHMARCGTCREYARFTVSLRERLSMERPEFLAAVPDFPLNEAGWAEAAAGRRKKGIFGLKPIAHPLPVAAAALVILAGVLILFQAVLRDRSKLPDERAAALTALKSVTAAPDDFKGIITEAESALAKEREILEKSIVSAVEYVQARLNIKIEKRDPAAKML